MGFMSSTPTPIAWKKLDSLSELHEILAAPGKKLFFKHSTRCGTSSMALKQFERQFDVESGISCYFLDLLKYREISNEIALRTGIYHQSPQVIVLQDEKVVYNASHHHIDAQTINHV